MFALFCAVLCSLLFLSSCCTNTCVFEPEICLIPQKCHVERLPSAFPELVREEIRQDWGKEMLIGFAFAKELDLYRAITAYKRALILIPDRHLERKMQIQYSILQCYYLGAKYADALDTYESGDLFFVTPDFPALRELAIMVYDAYYQTEQCEKAAQYLKAIENLDPCLAEDLRLYTNLADGACCFPENRPEVCVHMDCYNNQALSEQKAQTLNAILPGAGYYYIGQKSSALTSFLINGLFIWATYSFFDNGYIAAGLITASLESGWYFGGINGARLAAQEHNQHLYEACAKEAMLQGRLFPILQFSTTF